MLFEMNKALDALRRPGVRTNPIKMLRNGAAYYLPFLSPPTPLTIYWSINSVCNLRCKMCDVGTCNEDGLFFKNLRIDRKLHEIDIEVFKRVVNEVASYKPFMAINSTEPLLYKPLGEAIAYCSEQGVATGVTTGGYTLSSRAEELALAGLQRLNVSLDGPCDVHNYIRGRNDSFERATDGIRAFREATKKAGREAEITVNCTITNLNYHSLDKFIQSVADLPIDRIGFQFMWFIDPEVAAEQNALHGGKYPVTASCFGEHMDPYLVKTSVLAHQIEVISKHPKVRISPTFDEAGLERYFYHPEKFVTDSARCLASWFFVQVLADGEVIVYSRCHNQSLGNINTESIAEIWNGEKIVAWRDFIRNEKKMPMCRRCDLVF